MQHFWSVRNGRALLATIALSACGVISSSPDTATVTVQRSQEFQLAPGQTAVLAGSDLAVRFDSVAGDSRCPMGVMCIWSGDADIHLTLFRGKRMPTPVVIRLMREPRSVTDLNDTIEVVSLAPVVRQQGQIKPSDYRVTLNIRTK
ncbi:MAG: hypothetical protein U0132_03335 [Gemmatimonadaceae bacterium]